MGIFDFVSDIGDGLGDAWNVFSGNAASRDAARAQKAGIDQATNVVNKQYEQNKGYLTPYTQYGTEGANKLSSLLNAPGFDKSAQDYNMGTRPGEYQAPAQFQAKEFNYQQDPGYQARLREATDAAQKSAAAKGMLGSSNTLGTIARNAGDIASQDYQNAFARNQAENAQNFGMYQDQRNFGNAVNQQNLGQYNQDRNFGQGQYNQDFQNFLNNRGQLADVAGGLTNTGLKAAGGLADLGQVHSNTLSDLITGRANVTAQNSLNQYANTKGTIKDLIDGGKDVASLIAGLG